MARARRGDLGGPRAAPALHPLQGDGLGRLRPRRQGRRGIRLRVRRRDPSVDPRRGPRRHHRQRLRRRPQHLHPVLRLRGAGRGDAPDPGDGLPAARRRARDRDDRGDRARADDRGRIRPALLDGVGATLGRRSLGQGGGLPPVLVLARGRARDGRAPRRGARAVRAAARPLQRRRPDLRGVRPGNRPADRELPPGVHPPGPDQHRLGARRLQAAAAGGRAGG